MATVQTALNATSTASNPVPYNPDRRFAYIRNYTNSGATMWVLFVPQGSTAVATAGTNGELEILPGMDYEFGGKLDPTTKQLPGSFKLPNVPLEGISIITSGGTATGTFMQF
jgi:hypothetical protein